MITLRAGMRVYLACGTTDMRRGFDSLAAQVQTVLRLDPFSGALFVFRGKRGDHTSFCIPIAVCCHSLSLASIAWRALACCPTAGTRCRTDCPS
jgi:transposase